MNNKSTLILVKYLNYLSERLGSLVRSLILFHIYVYINTAYNLALISLGLEASSLVPIRT